MEEGMTYKGRVLKSAEVLCDHTQRVIIHNDVITCCIFFLNRRKCHHGWRINGWSCVMLLILLWCMAGAKLVSKTTASALLSFLFMFT